MTRHLLSFLVLFFCSSGVIAKKIYVNDNSLIGDVYTTAVGAAINNGTTTATPKLTLTQAYSIASSGDTIYVDAGTYNNDKNINITINGLQIIGAGYSLTIFDHLFLGTSTDYFVYINASNVTLKDLKVTGYENNGTQIPGHSAQAITIGGGATAISGVLIENIQTISNGQSGGNPAIVVLANTTATITGGGSFCNSPGTMYSGGVEAFGVNINLLITDYILGDNYKVGAFDGGGLRIEGDATTLVTVKRTRISNNVASQGGGISVINGDLKMYDCVIDGNSAGQTLSTIYGGGIYISAGNVRFSRCHFKNNFQASGTLRGGAISARYSATGGFSANKTINATIDSCIFQNNSPGTAGMDIYGANGFANPCNITVRDCQFLTGGSVTNPNICSDGTSPATSINVSYFGTLPTSTGANITKALSTNPIYTPTQITPVYSGSCPAIVIGPCTGSVSITSVINPTICSGSSATITASGATTYTLTSNTQTLTGNPFVVSPTSNTSYTVTGSNTTGCLSSNTAVTTITVNPTPTVSIASVSNPTLCSGVSAIINVAGAANYTLNPGNLTGTNFTVSPTANQTYSLTGTSAVGCISSNTAITTITVNTTPTVSIASVSNPTLCSGASAVITASGASTYAWLPATNLSSITGSVVTASPTITTIYTVTGTSAAGCVATKTTVITVNPNPAATIATATNPSCGLNNGIITIIPTNTVSISTITSTSGTVTGQTITGLGAGSPTITLTSNLGCTFTLSPTLTVTPGPSSISITPTNATCGNNNGSFTFGNPTGGTPLYSYAINGGAFSATSPTTGLTPGTYSVTVKDGNGCLLTQTTSIIAASTPTAITGTVSPASCAGATGSYTVTGVSGGVVGTYSYSIDGGAFNTSTVITNLSSGTHTIAVKDANGCTFPFQTTFSVGVVAGITSATVNASTASCGVANATATVTTILGGTPSYSFSFDNSAFSGSSSVTGLAAGNHTVIIRDANACNLSLPFTVISLGSPTTSITSFSNVTCFGLSNGSCTVAIPTGGGGANYTYTLTSSPLQIAGPTTGTGVFSGLPAGTYNVSVKDAAGCIATTSVIIGQPAALTVSATATPVLCNGASTGSINLSGSGGTTTYSYNLNGGTYQASSTFSNQVAGIYTMGIKDVNGCLATQTVQITQPTALAIAVSSQSANCTAANGIASATVS
ncbi:MAG: hypothetical protein K9H41_06305, partial [Bacteroidia bacterium]|nr:hypothetical protein [Bacteroidia bacterium]